MRDLRDIFLHNMILRNVFYLNLCSHWSTFHYYLMTEFFKGYFRLAEKICSIQFFTGRQSTGCCRLKSRLKARRVGFSLRDEFYALMIFPHREVSRDQRNANPLWEGFEPLKICERSMLLRYFMLEAIKWNNVSISIIIKFFFTKIIN